MGNGGKFYRLAAISVCQLLEDSALLFNLAVVGEQAKTVFEAVERESSIDVVAVPIGEPTNAGLNAGCDGALEPLRLLLVGDSFPFRKIAGFLLRLGSAVVAEFGDPNGLAGHVAIAPRAKGGRQPFCLKEGQLVPQHLSD